MVSTEIEKLVYGAISEILHMHQSQICKHFVCLNLLSALEIRGFPVLPELAKAVVDSDDYAALYIIERL